MQMKIRLINAIDKSQRRLLHLSNVLKTTCIKSLLVCFFINDSSSRLTVTDKAVIRKTQLLDSKQGEQRQGTKLKFRENYIY